MDFLIYLLKSSALLLLFFLFYYTFLKQDTYHQFKRKYLISALFISILLPLLKFSRTVTLTSNAITTSADINSSASSITSEQLVTKAIAWQEIVLYSYLLVSSILLIRLIYKYAKLHLSINKKDYKVIDQCKVHIVDEQISPFSFFKHIIISKKDFESDESEMILTHEIQHIKNSHYIDILLMNLFCVAFWFHPIIWIYKKLAIQNLEHQADDYSLQQIDEKIKYQYLLVNSSLQNTDFQLIESNIFQPSIKQRIMMMNKKNTRKIYALKSLILLPVLAFLFMSFQTEVTYKKSPASQALNTSKSLNNFQFPDSLKKNNRIIVKFTQEADREYLAHVKSFLRSNYDIDIAYSNIQFDDDLLTGLEVAVDCNDDFSGSAGSAFFSVTGGIYFYRDYAEGAEKPFGVGTLPLPKFDTAENKEKQDDIKVNSQIMISPSKRESNNLQEVSFKEDEISAKAKISKEKLLNIDSYIINDESYSVDELKQKTIVLDEFEFLDEKTLKIEGEIVDLEDYKKYFKTKLDESQDNRIQNMQMIIFLKNQDPLFANINEFKVSED